MLGTYLFYLYEATLHHLSNFLHHLLEHKSTLLINYEKLSIIHRQPNQFLEPSAKKNIGNLIYYLLFDIYLPQ